MNRYSWLMFGGVIAILALAIRVGVTGALFSDTEISADNSFQGWTSNQWVQTTQADFQAGVLSQVDATSSPGDVKLAATADNVTDTFNDETWIASGSNLTVFGGQVKLSSTSVTETLRPNGVGSLTEITYTTPSSQPHWSMVDEATSDDDTTQVWSVTQAYQTDLYALSDTTLTGTINKVTVYIRVMGQDIASYHALAREAIRTNGTNFFGTEHVLPATWTNYSYEWTTNPYTGNPWTWAEINALEAGVSIGYQNTGYYSRCTQVYAVVDYTAFNSSGTLTSTNLLAGQSVASINSFGYNASAIPSGTSLEVQFSQDNTNWYNSSGNSGGWDTLSQGTSNISLSALAWSGANFYYKMQFTSDGTATPVLDEISVNYSSTYPSSGTIASQVLDTGVAEAGWNSLFWDETLQASTNITFEVRASDTAFLKDAATPSWTSVGGTSPVTSGLPPGRYKQWRATLITSDTSKTPTLHEVRAYYY
ncbi:MAG: hypothetical protein HYX84_05345 [Chloroflexi bacterium]|nr:hypothetical protein [Chloroflexota bacterium]